MGGKDTPLNLVAPLSLSVEGRRDKSLYLLRVLELEEGT